MVRSTWAAVAVGSMSSRSWEEHGILDYEKFDEVDVNGIRLVDWIEALLAGNHPTTSTATSAKHHDRRQRYADLTTRQISSTRPDNRGGSPRPDPPIAHPHRCYTGLDLYKLRPV